MSRDAVWILWDLGAVILLVYCINSGAKKGFLRSVLSALAYVIAAITASTLSPKIAEWGYVSFVQQRLHQTVTQAVGSAFAGGAQSVTEVVQSLPEWLQGIVTPYVVGGQSASVELEQNARSSILLAVETAVREPITWLINMLVFIILFLLVAFLMRQISKLFRGVNRIPIIGTANMFLGGVIGVVQSAALLLLVSVILSFLVTITAGQYWWLSDQVLRSTYILGVIYRWLG